MADVGKREAWVLAITLGAATCLYAFGLDFVLGRGAFWAFPHGDAQTQLIGYRYFVADAWHFPLLKTTLATAPNPLNIAAFDSIPIVALAAKLARSVVRPNLYGAWMLAVYVLQARFAIRLVGALGARTRLAALTAAVVAIGFHAFLGRFYHQALNGQFVILWGLALYVERPVGGWRFGASWCALLVVALLVHPYLFAMVAAIFASALAHGLRLDLRTVRIRALAAVTVFATIAVAGMLTGHFAGSMRKAAAMCCYGDSSLNVASLFMPNQTRSLLWPDTPGFRMDQTGVQWDGSMFLGFGVLLVCAVILVRAPREALRALGRHRALVCVLVAMLLFAISNRGYFLDHTLWSFELPASLTRIAETFRASGRFAWPFGLALALGTVAFAARHLPQRVSLPLLVTCTAITAIEAWPSLQVIRANTRTMDVRLLDRDAYLPAFARHRRVYQFPSYQCLRMMEPALERDSRELQFMAAELALPINGVRLGRRLTNCYRQGIDYVPYADRPGELAFYARAIAPAMRPDRCRGVGNWVVCTDAWADVALARLRALADADVPPRYTSGQPLDLGDTKSARSYLDGGWSDAWRYSYTGIRESEAALRMMLDAPGNYALAVDLAGLHGRSRVRIRVGDAVVAEVVLGVEDRHLAVSLPPLPAGPLRVVFDVERVSADSEVGVGLVTLTIPSPPPSPS